MDPSLVQFLEEDEDETMHSGADVDALTAALNRDIEGDTSTSSDTVLSQGSSHTTSQFLPQWQMSRHDENFNGQNQQDLMGMEQKAQRSSQLDLQRGSDSGNQKGQDDSLHEINRLPSQQNPSAEVGQKLQAEQDTGSVSQPTSNQQPMATGTNNQQSKSTGTGNHQTTAMGISNPQTIATGIQHPMGSGMSSQHPMASGMSSQHPMASGISNQQPMTSGIGNQQAVNTSKFGKQVPFGLLLPIIQPQLDKDRAMQLHTLYSKLKKNEISKDGFVQHMRSVVGDQMLKLAVYKLQTQANRNSQTAPNQFPSQPQASGQQLQMPSKAKQTESRNPAFDGNALNSGEVEYQVDPHGIQVSQMPSSSLSALNQERKHPPFSVSGINKHQQQHLHFPQTSLLTHGTSVSSYPAFSSTNISPTTSIRHQSNDSQMRQLPAHQNMNANQLGTTAQAVNVMNMPKFDRPNTFSEPKKVHSGMLTHMNNSARQKNLVQWPSSTSKEQKMGVPTSITYAKQEPIEQLNDQQQKAQSSIPQGLSSVQIGQENAVPGNLKDDSVEMQSSRMGFATTMNTVPANSVSSSIPSLMDTNASSNSWIPSATSPSVPGNNSKVPLRKTSFGLKKQLEALGSSPPPSSKKQKVSGTFSDQSIEQLNDVTAVSGVNLREEEEQLFSSSKEESRISEASRRAVQEEEEKLILHKIPLQKKLTEIMAKCGLKSISSDVERCLSLCVEERMRGLITNLIRLSKQRVDIEKPRHRTIITSDVRQQIMTMNQKAREEWEKKQAEAQKLQKLNDLESSTGVDADKEKDESRVRSAKVNKEEDDKMRATAANVAVRAATGVSDMLSRWQLMIEAKQNPGGTDAASGSQPGKDVAHKALPTSLRRNKDHQEAEKREHSASANTPVVRKVGRNQVVPRVARSISIKDVIAILEREPQMSKTTLIYRLYKKVCAGAVTE